MNALVEFATHLAQLNESGASVVRGVFNQHAMGHARHAFDALPESVRRGRAGVRNALQVCPPLYGLASDAALVGIANQVLGAMPLLTRAILFDKTAKANWDLAWHQDTTIAVRERINVPGFGPWSVKDGVAHVQPPAAVLERMVTLRVAIDDCGTDNGPLLVLPGTHLHGILGDNTVPGFASDGRRAPIVCTCAAGDVVLMRPLVLHGSRKAASPSRRRVLHLEFASDSLPGGFAWAEAST